jgi:hypothetical protein
MQNETGNAVAKHKRKPKTQTADKEEPFEP